jgi:hypothetical protein
MGVQAALMHFGPDILSVKFMEGACWANSKLRFVGILTLT